VKAFKEVIASKYNLSAVLYRYKYGLKDDDAPMCVGIQHMINPNDMTSYVEIFLSL